MPSQLCTAVCDRHVPSACMGRRPVHEAAANHSTVSRLSTLLGRSAHLPSCAGASLQAGTLRWQTPHLRANRERAGTESGGGSDAGRKDRGQVNCTAHGRRWYQDSRRCSAAAGGVLKHDVPAAHLPVHQTGRLPAGRCPCALQRGTAWAAVVGQLSHVGARACFKRYGLLHHCSARAGTNEVVPCTSARSKPMYANHGASLHWEVRTCAPSPNTLHGIIAGQPDGSIGQHACH